MAIQFQYNKTYLQQLNKGLRVRENALPTLVAKESALRLEVKKAKEQFAAIDVQIRQEYQAQETTLRLWRELPESILTIGKVDLEMKKTAGVKTPILKSIGYSVKRYSAFSHPAWVPEGIEILKKLSELTVRKDLAQKKVVILEFARRKTTQKVNLYEKVQIPEYKEAIRKIKRFLEDEENLAKSAQKILKARLAAAEVRAS